MLGELLLGIAVACGEQGKVNDFGYAALSLKRLGRHKVP